MIVKEVENFIKSIVFNSFDILSQLFQSALRLCVAMRMVKDIYQLPDNVSEAGHKTLILAFQRCNGLLFLTRYIRWLFEEAPAQFPSLLGPFDSFLIAFFFTASLALPAGG